MLTYISGFLTRLMGKSRNGKGTSTLSPKILSRKEHSLSRKDLSQYVLKVLYRLQQAGYQAYLVGGGVRDVLLGLHPKDFDVATDALPEQVYQLFRNSRMIGRRFRLVHVFFGDHIVEVATFRAQHPEAEKIQYDSHSAKRAEGGMLIRDNVYGALEDDVWRRDFTVNALYYNIADFTIVDYANGLADLKARVLRMIGNPTLRYREDPVRMLRAIRFAAKLKFTIHPDTEKPIFELSVLLSQVAPARLFDEYLKLFLSGFAHDSFQLLRKYKLLVVLFPLTEKYLIEAFTQDF